MKLIDMINSGVIVDNSVISVFVPQHRQLEEGTLKTFDKYFGERFADLIVRSRDGNSPKRWLHRGIEVPFLNASNPDQTRSAESQVIWLDEAAQMDESIINLTNANLRGFGLKAKYLTMITSTPRGRNWLYRTFVDPATRQFGDDKLGYYQTSTVEAKKYGFIRDGYIEGLAPKGSDKWRQEVEAEFVTWAGLVFDKFHPLRHCPDPMTPPQFSHVYGGIDVGYGGITAMLLTGVTPNGAMYTFKEYYRRSADPHEWMRTAAEWSTQYNVHRWYIDAAADHEYRAMKQILPVYRSIKAKDAAGSAVGFINSKFARDELFIDRAACPFLVSEIETYQYKELPTGNEMTFLEKTKPNQPDHAIDAWRYHVFPLSASMAAQNYGKSVEFAIA